MSEGAPVSLNRARKARARAEARRRADENAARHGLPKAEREAEARRAALAATRLEAHRREPGDAR